MPAPGSGPRIRTARSAGFFAAGFGFSAGSPAVSGVSCVSSSAIQSAHRLRSIYGWHLVHVDERLPGRLATVDEVRAQAREGLLREAREQAVTQAMDELRERYVVEIEGRDE